jgi:hypothetical protein
MDATLLELTGLVREVNFEARRRGTRFSFAQVIITLFSVVLLFNWNDKICTLGVPGAT